MRRMQEEGIASLLDFDTIQPGQMIFRSFLLLLHITPRVTLRFSVRHLEKLLCIFVLSGHPFSF